jgi:FKBP-type peptidyl-prolyl cis-trans isomerase FklB
MRFLSWSLGVVLMASVAVAAQDSQEKQAAPSKESSGEDRAQPAEDEPEAPADEKPTKKNTKKAIPLKLAGDDETKILKTISYMQGFGMGKELFQRFNEQGVELDEEVFFAALKDGLAGKEPTMSEEEMKNAMASVQKYLREKYAAKSKELAAKNKEEGAAFLAENKKKEGVKTLPSGLQYKVLKSGKGETPKKTDTVRVHYKGSFVNEQEFESSYKSGTPATFPIAKLVPGMSEGLQLMKVGDKWRLFLPSNLAYGEQGNPVIPPNATLIFDLELLGIEKGGKTPTGLPALK